MIAADFGKRQAALNAISPYFTMFPLAFPLRILEEHAEPGDLVLDPFCGRGTTTFAARLLGLDSLGVDSSPIAVAIAQAKTVNVTPEAILHEAKEILVTHEPEEVPRGEFWSLAFEESVLKGLCALRESLLSTCESPARIALRGLVLGALHGPRNKGEPSYFSNQAPRTYAPKPAYAMRYWQRHGLLPADVDIAAVIWRRAVRYYGAGIPSSGEARLGDSRDATSLRFTADGSGFGWIITSPPYYGMRTYVPDQWLRNWFVGGPSTVPYSEAGHLVHESPQAFAAELRTVWANAATVARPDARLIVRFGGITDRRVDPQELIHASLEGSGWSPSSVSEAGSAHSGKRQADAFLRNRSRAIEEIDVWCTRTGSGQQAGAQRARQRIMETSPSVMYDRQFRGDTSRNGGNAS